MPMSFGSSSEPREETRYERRLRKRKEAKETLSNRFECFERLVTLCAVRDRSTTELRKRLTNDGYNQERIDEALGRAQDCGLVDDMRFAESLVRGRVRAGKGKATIEKELEEHRIDPYSLEGWPAAYFLDDESQLERAVEFLNAHPPKAKDYYSAAFRKLISKGYSVALASKACRLWNDTRD